MNLKQWRGVTALLRDAVEHGSVAVEKLQKDTAKLPFDVLEIITPIAPVARVAHTVFDASVSATHGSIRLVARVAAAATDAVLASIEERSTDLKADEVRAKDSVKDAQSSS